MLESNRNQNPTRRPWYRLHLSTWLTLPLGIIVAGLVMLPGELGHSQRSSWITMGDDAAVVHGWPLPYLWRSASEWREPTLDLPSLPWKLWDSVEEFRLFPLIADMAFAGAGLAIFVALVEWRRRRQFRALQISLRELLSCVVVVAAALGWWRQNRAINREITDRFERVAPSGLADARLVPRLPLWLRMWAGDDRLTWLGTNGPNASIKLDWDLSRRQDIQSIIEQFPHETTVEMDLRTSSEDAAAVASIDRLEKICSYIQSPDAFAALFRRLEHHPKLREVEVFTDGSVFGDAQLAPIATLPRLESLALFIRPSRLTERGLAQLEKCRNLRKLELHGATLTKGALDCLCDMKQLQRLSLNDCKFVNADFKSLRKLNALEELDLSETNLHDADALQLRAMPNLHRLEIDHTRMTKRGLIELLDPTTDFAVHLDQTSLGAGSLGDEVITAIKKLPGLRLICIRIFGREAGSNYAQLISKLEALPDREIMQSETDKSAQREDPDPDRAGDGDGT